MPKLRKPTKYNKKNNLKTLFDQNGIKKIIFYTTAYMTGEIFV